MTAEAPGPVEGTSRQPLIDLDEGGLTRSQARADNVMFQQLQHGRVTRFVFKGFCIRFPLTLAGSSPGWRQWSTEKKKAQSDATKLTKVTFVCIKSSSPQTFCLFSLPFLRLSCNIAISFSRRPHPFPR